MAGNTHKPDSNAVAYLQHNWQWHMQRMHTRAYAAAAEQDRKNKNSMHKQEARGQTSELNMYRPMHVTLHSHMHIYMHSCFCAHVVIGCPCAGLDACWADPQSLQQCYPQAPGCYPPATGQTTRSSTLLSPYLSWHLCISICVCHCPVAYHMVQRVTVHGVQSVILSQLTPVCVVHRTTAAGQF